MIDYWTKYNINDCWGKEQRFNFIMNYIDQKLSPSPEPEDDTCDVTVTVKNKDGDTVADATVSIYDKGEPYEATTNNDGVCTITDVPYGNYTIEATAEGYDFAVEQIFINTPVLSKELILPKE